MDQELIDRLITSFRESQILFAACRLSLFDLLRQQSLPTEKIATALRSDPRGTRILLDALVGLGLMQKKASCYTNSPISTRFLTSDSSQSRLAQVLHAARLYERWAGLYDSVLSGQPVSESRIDERLKGGKREFARAMADSARETAIKTARALDLSGCESLLDIGGGPGTYAIAFAKRWPDLQVTILDDAETLEIAHANLRPEALLDRVRLREGDAFTDDLQGPFDFIFISNLIHIYPAANNVELIRKCQRSLNRDGRLALKDFFLSEDRTGPSWSTVFAAQMLVATECGDCYTLRQVDEWIRRAGLRVSQVIPLTEKTSLIIGVNDKAS